MSYLIEGTKISNDFFLVSSTIHVLKGIDIHVEKKEFLSIMGPSGSGKSTFLYILGCLERTGSGKYFLDGLDISIASDRELSRIRATRIGFVFQTFNLLSHLNIFENVELPFLYSSMEEHEIKGHVIEAIERVGLSHRLKHRPSELSGGEMQRVAVARAWPSDRHLSWPMNLRETLIWKQAWKFLNFSVN